MTTIILQSSSVFTLQRNALIPVYAGDGESALRPFKNSKPDLVLLDLMLPGMDGYQVCRAGKEQSDTPIIMLSAKGEVFDKVLGLELGADDYMEKPFDSKELVARVKAVLRRAGENSVPAPEPAAKDEVSYPDLEINKSNYSVIYMGRKVDMPPKELELFILLSFFTQSCIYKRTAFGPDMGI